MSKRPPGRPPKYPWRKIAVGESFFVPGKKDRDIKGCTWHLRPMRFRLRVIAFRGEIGTTVKRIA
jgi:hypothetical protein